MKYIMFPICEWKTFKNVKEKLNMQVWYLVLMYSFAELS